MSEHYSTALADACGGFEALKPPTRMSVSEGVAKNLVIQQPGSPKTSWSADETPYMVHPTDALASRRHEAVVFVGPARTGKCLDVDTPIPTPDGWVKMGDLKSGDVVFGPDGCPTRVLAAHSVKTNLPCYRVTFSDKTSLVADSEHLWGVERFYWKAPTWRYEVRTTQEMVDDLVYAKKKNGGVRFRYRIRQPEPLDLPEQQLPIDPYVLGVWLGNGRSSDGRIYQHWADTEHYEILLNLCGYESTVVRPDGDSCTEIAPRGLRTHLRENGLIDNKHIPAAYLRASKKQRIALLQGLMDTDGYPGGDRVGCEFSTINEALKDGFVELCRSLGLKPVARLADTTWIHNGERCHGTAWRVYFSVGNEVEPFILPRKAKLFRRTQVDTEFRQVVSIEPVESRPVRCIAVDNESKLFLAGDGMIPTHNTAALLLGWMSHAVVNDPGDMLYIQMSKDKAREFSKTDVDRAIRHSPNVQAMKSDRVTDSNTFDTMFRHGMWLRIAWPTVGNVSGSTYRYVAITDIDRIENAENVDGEGPLFDLAKKRTTTFLSRGMTLVESSPGYPFIDPTWSPATRHEAPPTGGILGLYNRSDRHRFYWQCYDCKSHFEAAPGLGLFARLPSSKQLLEEVRTMNIASMAKHYGQISCPHCGSEPGHKHKGALNKAGIWVPDGCTVTDDREVVGTPLQSTIRGYWLGGVAATYQSWESIVAQYLYGLLDYALTGSEEKLKQTTNTDQGMPYMARHLVEAKSAGMSPRDRAEKDLLRFIAPEPTRAVLVSVDVQGGQNARFDVQVHAVGPHGEQWVIDRFKIDESKREGTMPGEFAPLDPASYPEDWDVLTDKLVMGTWRTTVENIEMHPLAVIVDSGGEDGVTHNAYAWYRRVRAMGLGKRVFLYKGGSTPNAPDMRETMVGKIGNKGRNDIPLLHCNPNKLSDGVDAGLRRQTFGPGYIHLPAPRHPTDNPNGWVSAAFFDELEAETRNKDGTWVQRRSRNETFDHCRMQRALMLRLGVFKVDDWSRVPAWFAPVEKNTMAITKQDRREVQANLTVSAPQEDRPQQPMYPIARRKRPRRSSAPSF